MPKNRPAHAYMHARNYSDRDTVSLAYPNLNDGGSSVYAASLTSKVLAKLRKEKRKILGDESSVGEGTVHEERVLEEEEDDEDPDEQTL
jgi:hypothetical protein